MQTCQSVYDQPLQAFFTTHKKNVLYECHVHLSVWELLSASEPLDIFKVRFKSFTDVTEDYCHFKCDAMQSGRSATPEDSNLQLLLPHMPRNTKSLNTSYIRMTQNIYIYITQYLKHDMNKTLDSSTQTHPPYTYNTEATI
jgi:hypothetical protein